MRKAYLKKLFISNTKHFPLPASYFLARFSPFPLPLFAKHLWYAFPNFWHDFAFSSSAVRITSLARIPEFLARFSHHAHPKNKSNISIFWHTFQQAQCSTFQTRIPAFSHSTSITNSDLFGTIFAFFSSAVRITSLARILVFWHPSQRHGEGLKALSVEIYAKCVLENVVYP